MRPLAEFADDIRTAVADAGEGATAARLEELRRMFEARSLGAVSLASTVTEGASKEARSAAHLIRFIDMFALLASIRHAELIEDVVVAANSHRPLATALAARALLESSAAVAYYHEQVITNKADDLGRHLAGSILASRFEWEKLSEGKAARDEWLAAYAAYLKGEKAGLRALGLLSKEPLEDEATNVLTMLESLRLAVAVRDDSKLGLVGFTYALLSDVCHPSYGGHAMSLQQGEVFERVRSAGTIAFVLGNTLPGLVVSCDAAIWCLTTFDDLRSAIGEFC